MDGRKCAFNDPLYSGADLVRDFCNATDPTVASLRLRVWNRLEGEGLVGINRIVLRRNTWVSETRKGTITLGLVEMSERERLGLYFRPESFGYADQVFYRFSHEIGHIFMPILLERFPKVRQIFGTALHARQHGLGFSILGSYAVYQTQGPSVRASEDLVELLHMPVYDPKIFSDYMVFLGDPFRAPERQALALVSFPPRVVDYVSKTVLDSLNDWLG